jgi:hypothetical protein
MIAQYAQVILYKLGARTWWEWVDSASNPSDGLSRLGVQNPWTLSQNWLIQEYSFRSQLLPAYQPVFIPPFQLLWCNLRTVGGYF